MILKGPKTEDSHRKQYLTTPLLDELHERLARIEENQAFFREEYRDYGLLICQTDGRPVDPRNLEKSFKEHQDVYKGQVYVEMTLGIAFTASIWAVVALAIAIWIPDKLLTVTIPSFLYYLWNANVVYYFTGIKTPHPAILFNDGLTIEKAIISIEAYLIILGISMVIYYIRCKTRCQNA